MRFKSSVVGLACLALLGCETLPPEPTTSPQPRPAGLAAPKPKPETPKAPSKTSEELAFYYKRVEQNHLIQGLMRVDGGGVDTPYTASNLNQNFENLVFFQEYPTQDSTNSGPDASTPLSKWRGPVYVSVEFGLSVPPKARESDRRFIQSYLSRLSRVTKHSINYSDTKPNFHVLVMSYDERDQTLKRVKEIHPQIDTRFLNSLLLSLKDVSCFVVAYSNDAENSGINRAISIVRSELPTLSRKGCYHEEIAQGLGLPNDSPRARPSIFNDDDEFALLTTHDEELLRTLYNPALKPGMSAEEARPIVSQIIAARSGPS